MEELRGHRRPTKSSFGHVHSAPFPAKSDAYGEIFDETANSCSIPFLDLPPPAESFDGGSIGYSEIFCAVKGGDFAVDYEELPKKGVECLDSSSGRVYTDVKFSQKEERPGLSLEDAIFKDYGASPENKIQSISNHSDDGSNAVEQEKTHSFSYSTTENTQNYRADMKTKQEYSNKHAALEDASVSIKHDSHSSTSYSASSADVPPTKTQPKIIRKQENTKMEKPRTSTVDQEGNLLKPTRNHQIRYKLGAPKSRGLQTPDSLDAEAVDTGSAAAAASVAAMKEAMEQAQARLKRAKELMERQRDNNERRKKPGHRDGSRYDERKDAKASEEFGNFREGTPNKTLPKEDRYMKDHAFDDPQKITDVGKAPPHHEESHTDAVMKISAAKEGEQEDTEKKLKTTTKINEVKGRYSEEDGLAHEFNRTVSLHTVNALVEEDEIGENKKQNANRAPSVVVDNVKTDLLRGNHTEGNLERETSIEREYEKEQARKAKEEKEMERERDEDRLGVERAAREEHERIAVGRATAEARQRSLGEARGKAAQKASAEASEKSLLEKALKEAKLRAERAAVERATAEARERAVEKAIAEKAAADARRRAERLNSISRDKSRKENEAGSGMGDGGIKLKASSSEESPLNVGEEEESASRCKARSERHQRTVERAAKALEERNSRDVVAQREQEERNRFAEMVDADVRRWSAGKEGNLRALLSTLQYILGPESGWQSIPLTDVITAAAVKKAYRKATLFVHPDKLQQRGASIQQKYICEKVFDLLKEAWNKFNSEER